MTLGLAALLVASAVSSPALAQGLPADPMPHVMKKFVPGGPSIAGDGTTDMSYHGGPIQKVPKVYLVFWGWQGVDANNEKPYLINFLSGVGGTGWARIQTQYSETARGLITNPAGQLAGQWADDSSTPANGFGYSAIAAEAVAAQVHFGYDQDANYFIATPSGHSSSDFTANGGEACAWHSWTTNGGGQKVAFTNFPYMTDAGGACGQNYVNGGGAGLLDGVSIVAGHEYAETVTDPGTGDGWYDNVSVLGGENGDKCAWLGTGPGRLQNIFLPTGTFAVQGLWSNADHKCIVTIGDSVWVPNALPQARGYTAAVFAGGYAYIIGGAGCPGTWCNDILRYDPGSASAPTVVATMPSGLASPSAAYDGSRYVYIFGGQAPGSPYAYPNSILRFDTITNGVTTLSFTLPTGRMFTSAVWVNGNAYVFGGLDGSGNRLGDILKFNPSTGISNTGQVLFYNMYGMAAVATGTGAGSVVYLYGGDAGSGPTTFVEKYDPGANLRTALFSEAMPIPLDLAAATWDPTVGSAYIFGGYPGSDKILQHTPGASPIVLNAKLPTPRDTLSAVLDNRHAVPASLIIGGLGGVKDIVRFSPNNHDPVAAIGSFTNPIECTGSARGSLVLTSASSDVDSDPLTYAWSGSGTYTAPAAAATAATFQLGSNTVILAVGDGEDHMDVVTQPLTVQDSVAPVTTAAPSGTTGNNGWYRGSPVSVTFSASDACGSALTTQRALDGGGFSPGTTLSLSGDLIHTVQYYTQDASNSEATRTLSVKIDATPPATTASLSGTSGLAGWYTSAVTLTFTASDATSGVASTFCKIDGAAATTGSSCTVTPDGGHTVTYWSTDNAGNTESTHSVAANVDATAPSTTHANAGTAGSGGWFRSAVTVTLTPSDAASGIASTVYSLDGGPTATGTSVVVSGEGTHTLTYHSTDVAGNVETSKTDTVEIDTLTPAAAILSPEPGSLYTFDVRNPSVPPLPITTIVGGKTVFAAASDPGVSASGINHVDFFVDNVLVGSDNAAPYQVFYNEKLLGSGLHIITATAYDLAGNSGTDNRQVLVVGTGT